MTVALFLSDSSGFGALKPPSSDFINRNAQKLINALTRLQNPKVRGHIVASDYLVHALLQNNNEESYTIITRPWMKSAVQASLHSWKYAPEAIKVRSTEEVRNIGFEALGLTHWFAPLPLISITEGVEISQRMRSAYSSRVIPVTLLLHGLSMHKMLADFFLRIMLEGSYPCDTIVLSSHASKVALLKIFANISDGFYRQFGTRVTFDGSCEVIPLAVDTKRFVPHDKKTARRKFGIPLEAFVLLYIGKLSPLKADLLPTLDMLGRLIRKTSRRIFLALAGSDESQYAELLRTAIKERALSRHTILIEDLSEDNKPLLLSAADVFISPSDSLQESFGLAPVEAMSCGVPQIVPNWDGYKETVEHGVTGFLVPTYWTECTRDLLDSGVASAWMFDHLALGQSVAIDMSETERYVEELANNISLQKSLSEASTKRAKERFSYESVIRQYQRTWEHQTLMAVGMQKTVFPFQAVRPQYYECFGHYASVPLSGSTRVHLNKGHLGSLTERKRVRYKSLPGFLKAYHLLDDDLLNTLLDNLSRVADHDPGRQAPSLDDLVMSVSTDSRQQDYILRHVMWLIKYAFVSPLD